MSSTVPFAAAVSDTARILVIELGGLGDQIHGLPALKMLRASRPQACLHAMVSAGNGSLIRVLAPWIDRVIEYDKQGLLADLRYSLALRAQHYDAVIVMIASNRAIALGGFSGAHRRLGRHADENKSWGWQDRLLTDVVDIPFHTEPMYRQRCRVILSAGFPGALPERLYIEDLLIDPSARRAAGISEVNDFGYLHLSASATDDRRDLPRPQMVALWEAVHQQFASLKIVVSSNNSARGKQKLADLLRSLSFAPWKVFAGNLDGPAFASVLSTSALHIGPDSGGLHLARLVGTPSVSWFRSNHHLTNWLPDEPEHRAFIAPESRADGLYGLDPEALVAAAARLPLSGREGRRQTPA